MRFSIVITTYNRLSLLKRAIATSLNQTVPCEVVVVDDCSSDGTQDYVTELVAQLACQGNNRLIYHRNEQNLGHSESVNAGVHRATGDWIKGLDDDDYLALNCIEEMSRAIALRPQAVICSCRAAQVTEQEEELFITEKVGPGKAFYIPQEDIHHGMLLEAVPFGTPVQVAFRRDAFLRSGGWDSTLDANFDDIDSWVKITQFGDAIFINSCLAYRTVWPGSYNQKFSLKTRLDTHIIIKTRIYALVNQKYRSTIPSLKNIEEYLKLHWSLVALKQGKVFKAAQLSKGSTFSLMAWKLLLQRFKHENHVNFLLYPHYSTFKYSSQILLETADYQWSYERLTLLRKYIQLRWGLVAFKKGSKKQALILFSSACLSFLCWQLLFLCLFPRIVKNNITFIQEVHPNKILVLKLAKFLNDTAEQSLSNIRELQIYLKIRLVQMALESRNWWKAFQLSLPMSFSVETWRLLFKIRRLQRANNQQPIVRKLILIDGADSPE